MTTERLLKADVSLEESKQIERVLRRNNISYFEKWNLHGGLLKFMNNSKSSKCTNIEQFPSVKEVLGE